MINRQRHRKACGPVAIVNALQWKNIDCSYKDILSFYQNFGKFKYDRGMSSNGIMNVLKKKDIKFNSIHKIKLKNIIEEIDKGNGLIIAFYHSKTSAHFVFIDKYTKKYIRAWNLTAYNKTPMFSRKELSKCIRYTNRWKPGTFAIIIEKQ